MNLRLLARLLRQDLRTWVLTAFFVIAPLGSVVVLAYLLGRRWARRRAAATPDPYRAWWALRDLRRAGSLLGAASLGPDASWSR